MPRARFSSNTIRSVGALLPSDVLAKAAAGEGLEGLADEDFGIDAPERLRDVIHAAWSDAQRLWWSFRSELRLGDETADPTATTPTRERWLLPFLEILGFEGIEVEGRAITVGDVGYPISHMWKATPMHLMGARVELDAKVAGVRGAASMSPHSLMQQMLNRSDKHLWGLVSNGRSLRLLRDSVSRTRQAFVEFDLDQDRDALASAGYASRMIPLFALPDAAGRGTEQRISGSIKGPGATANILPRLDKLLAGEPVN